MASSGSAVARWRNRFTTSVSPRVPSKPSHPRSESVGTVRRSLPTTAPTARRSPPPYASGSSASLPARLTKAHARSAPRDHLDHHGGGGGRARSADPVALAGGGAAP